MAKNELAKKYGIKTAELIWQAKIKCPELLTVLPHHNLYREYSGIVKGIYARYTSQVESFGLDEFWMDMTSSSQDFLFLMNAIKLSNSKLTSIIIMKEVTFRPKRAVIFRNRQTEGFEIDYGEISHWNISTCGCGQDDII
ncbi:Y-family DNA polymerase [Desulfosporosinus shakirovi]|uniref:Y-family DNA polymerase n=1 Tax=Desulfosporosinus shakirovi TaxID=2885154 RepID=UPI001E3E0173|nr:hypothetical protein [Desulfosporosinus sp. SRJS8]